MPILESFSPKQNRVFSWWSIPRLRARYDAVICDGAVRSGKTLCMSISFVLWALYEHSGGTLAMCGKTIVSLRRNVVKPLIKNLAELGIICEEKISDNRVEISCGSRRVTCYLFGGRDESSAGLIQGITLSGVLFDEVALMPRSFVEQAVARCSVEGSVFWFNCNPEHPQHWFYREWILQKKRKRALYLHFTMQDNPSLSERMRTRYQSLYSGSFYQRFIEGRWVAQQGLVYPMFSAERHVRDLSALRCERYVVSCDYGTVNPTSMGLWGYADGRWNRLAEYYYDSRREGIPRTDEQHYQGLLRLVGSLEIEAVVADPSAASFIQCIRAHRRFRVTPASNAVLEGIALVTQMLQSERIMIDRSCSDCIREFSLYRWEQDGKSDRPIKENDHAMDDLRYFAMWQRRKNGGFYSLAAEREL